MKAQDNNLLLENSFDETALPLISIRGMAIYPGMIFHFDISKAKSLEALNYSMDTDREVFLVQQRNDAIENPKINDFYDIGCYAHVKQTKNIHNDRVRVMVEVQERGRILDFIKEDPFFLVNVSPIYPTNKDNQENEVLVKLINAAFNEYLNLSHLEDDLLIPDLDEVIDPEELVDIVAANLDLDIEKAQDILKEADVNKRLFSLYLILRNEIEFIQIEQSIDEKIHEELDKNQREFVLREQIRILQDELGDYDDDSIEKYYAKLDSLKLPQLVKDKVEVELNRLNKMPAGSSESGVIESYIDWIFDLPWDYEDEVNLDVRHARNILNNDHYALDNVKERILEYISILKLSNNLKSPIICLVGPPGVGKTSIAKSIAKALGRKYVRLSLGGLRDEAEIRGHRRTYLGSIPGRIIYQLKMAKTKNPLILLDEIDKISSDVKGDPAAALLEVLDPEQNSTFTDNYLELPFDLSNVLFLTTANSTNTIPEPLLDRMEIIEVNGYVDSEKVEIARRYLIPELLNDHGLTSKQLRISKEAIKDIISFYTRESGVRELKRKLAKVCRISAKRIVEDKAEIINVTRKNLEEFLGKKEFLYDHAEDQGAVGSVTGLAWTTSGGETLQIETISTPGKGQIHLTGHLGKVMQESAQAALGFIKSKAKEIGIDEHFSEKTDIHIHVPEGAVPKDGPSAGITIASSLISTLLDKSIPDTLAMTGEITLRGHILPIGGLREKLAAAHRAGIKTVIFPKENEKDLEEVPKEILEAFKLYPVHNMDEVIKILFGEENDNK